ncbi:hypothetical protein D3C76_1728340 [compost metagenome]
MASRRQLPEIGDSRWHDQQGGSLRRRHSQAQKPHRNGRQAQADHAFYRASQHESHDYQQGQGRPDMLIESDQVIHDHHHGVHRSG